MDYARIAPRILGKREKEDRERGETSVDARRSFPHATHESAAPTGKSHRGLSIVIPNVVPKLVETL